MGLGMCEQARPGERVAIYTGEPISAKEAATSDSAYLLMVNKNLILDAQDPSHDKGRYINCGRMAGKPINATFGAARHASICIRVS